MGLTTRDFQTELDEVFAATEQEGQASVEVNSGDLHRRLGGYPASDHQMPICCQVMHANFRAETDTLVDSPPKGKGRR